LFLFGYKEANNWGSVGDVYTAKRECPVQFPTEIMTTFEVGSVFQQKLTPRKPTVNIYPRTHSSEQVIAGKRIEPAAHLKKLSTGVAACHGLNKQ
jgi:hypothetical protein